MTEDTWCAKLQGLALKNVNLALYFDGKEIYQGFGEMLFTHFGVSGPLVLSASSYYSAQLAKWTKKRKEKTFASGMSDRIEFKACTDCRAAG